MIILMRRVDENLPTTTLSPKGIFAVPGWAAGESELVACIYSTKFYFRVVQMESAMGRTSAMDEAAGAIIVSVSPTFES